jgi:hypothetical protein
MTNVNFRKKKKHTILKDLIVRVIIVIIIVIIRCSRISEEKVLKYLQYQKQASLFAIH